MNSRLRATIRKRTRTLADFVVEMRRDIHAHPELGNEEKRTPALIIGALQGLGYEIRERVGGTGVVAVLRGAQPGRTLALRADMDALPLNEQGERPYKSEVAGVMHACGHDGHVAMALGAARLLSELRDELHGNVKFLFQPAEETYGGASEMIADGCLSNDPKVDAVFGLHLWPEGDVGALTTRTGAVMASSDALRIIVHGKGGHASEPHACVDPVPIAAQIITNLQTMVTREIDARNPVVVTITYMTASQAFNVIPAEAIIAGTVRTVDPDVRAGMAARIERIAQHTALAFGGLADVTYLQGSGVVMNHGPFVDFVQRTISASRGARNVSTMPVPVMGSEDFGMYLDAVPGAFAFLGAKPSHQDIYPCHHPRFDIDEAALPIGVEILVTLAVEYLAEKGEPSPPLS